MFVEDCGEMYTHKTFGVPSYQGSGDMAHCILTKMAGILKMCERKKIKFSVCHTKPYLQHKIGDCCISFAKMDGRMEKLKTIYLPTF
jgi:hypothetical protein